MAGQALTICLDQWFSNLSLSSNMPDLTYQLISRDFKTPNWCVHKGRQPKCAVKGGPQDRFE